MMVFPSSPWYKDIVNQLPNGYFREVHVNGLSWTKDARVKYFDDNPEEKKLREKLAGIYTLPYIPPPATSGNFITYADLRRLTASEIVSANKLYCGE
ncbi:unnamed protein product [Oikopleura dioica]|uniref:Uncharacterized protein n=1 Tax=Oikopleura dioica TaxID=34765 RepID=E4XU12_OIKDI|nr:unnamed protein product [Oikopleura dioica]